MALLRLSAMAKRVALPRLVDIVTWVFLLVATLLVAQFIVGLRHVGLRLRGATISVALVAPLMLLTFGSERPTELPSLVVVGAVVLQCGLIGFSEELFGRGVLVTVLGGRAHPIAAIWGSSALFAYLHLPSYISQYGWRGALVRSSVSAAFCLVFAIIRLRSDSLVGPILFHMLDDARVDLMPPGTLMPPSSNLPITSLQPIGVGLLVALVYWVVCRRAIRRDPAPVQAAV